jgi:hypothetical protein
MRSTKSDAAHLDVYARSVVEHTAEGVERDIHWLNQLIEGERSAALVLTPGSMTPPHPENTPQQFTEKGSARS